MQNEKSTYSLEKEGILFGSYLLGVEPDQDSCSRYAAILENADDKINSSDRTLLSFIHKHPSFIGLIDSGLAITKPSSIVRKRIYTMFSILESSPIYTRFFLPEKRNILYLFVLLFSGVRAVVKAIAGCILIRIIT